MVRHEAKPLAGELARAGYDEGRARGPGGSGEAEAVEQRFGRWADLGSDIGARHRVQISHQDAALLKLLDVALVEVGEALEREGTRGAQLDAAERLRRAFLLSVGFFFLGWMAEALEVYAILYFIGGPAVSPLSAVAIGALSVFIKGGTFFIPGSLGAQEGGNLLVLVAFGYTELTGITFALLRRVRELVWIALGLGCLAALGGRQAIASGEVSRLP